jgi:hypothetical protein
MTIGIYRLCFNGTDQCYVGQSIDIEQRYKAHLNSFITCKANPKMMEAYNLYGRPSLEVVCECTVKELNSTENEAIEIFDSVNNGFNILEHATDTPIAYGQNHGRSIYTNEQIIKVATLLLNPNISFKEISSLTDVGIVTVKKISSLVCHGWLKNTVPEIYKKLRDLIGTRRDLRKSAKYRNIAHPAVTSPSGEIYTNIPNFTKFCIEHKLNLGHFTTLLKGNCKQHKGWRLAHNV